MWFAHKKMCKIIASNNEEFLVNYEEFKRRLGKAGLSVKEFADLVQISCNSVSNYSARGDVPVHLAIAVTLMSEMADHHLDFRSALQSLDVKEKKPRGQSGAGTFGGSKQYSII